MTIPIRPRVPVSFVADLTGVAFIDYACLSVLAIPAGSLTVECCRFTLPARG
jgi:uncharacterized membrane protein YdjX (TVP38/TMEM64 family)